MPTTGVVVILMRCKLIKPDTAQVRQRNAGGKAVNAMPHVI